jgi:hypothetical protein
MRGLPQKVGFAATSPPQQALAGQNAVTDAEPDERDLDRARPRLRATMMTGWPFHVMVQDCSLVSGNVLSGWPRHLCSVGRLQLV